MKPVPLQFRLSVVWQHQGKALKRQLGKGLLMTARKLLFTHATALCEETLLNVHPSSRQPVSSYSILPASFAVQ